MGPTPRWLCLVAAALVAPFAGCRRVTTPPPPPPPVSIPDAAPPPCGVSADGLPASGPLDLTIERLAADGVPLRLTLRNRSRRRYWIRREWAIGAPDAPRTVYPLWFRIRSRTRPVVEINPIPFEPLDPSYVALDPGEELHRDIDLAGVFDFGTPGCFELQAFYRDTLGREPARPRGVSRLDAVIVSPPFATVLTADAVRPPNARLDHGRGRTVVPRGQRPPPSVLNP